MVSSLGHKVWVVVLLGLFVAAVAATSAVAQTPEEVRVKVGKDATFPLPRQPLTLGIEDAEIATVEVLEDGQARVTGVKVGKTRVIGKDHAQVPIIIKVDVVPDED